MAGMQVSGLVSGLDTATIVNQLMQLEAAPQNALKAKVTRTGSQVTAYQAVNTRLTAAVAAADKLTKDVTWGAATASSSVSSVTVTSSPGAVTGSLRFSVDRLATAHMVASPTVAAGGSVVEDGRTELTLLQGGVATTVPLEGSDPVSVAKAINASGAGIRAVALPVANGVYRLQVTSLATGEAGAFSVQGLTVDDAVTVQGQDARILVGGTLPVQSADGRFTDVLPGTTFTVGAVVADVQLTVRKDDLAVTASVKAVVDALNAALKEIGTASRSGAGALSGDSLLRSLTQQLVSTVSGGTTSAVAAGVQTTRTGEVAFDAERFTSLLTSDPTRARTLVEGIASRVAEVARAASSASDGTVTVAARRRQDSIRGLNEQVAAWDTRLAMRRATLERQYSALETALGSLQSQSSWLAGQLGGLPSWSSS